MGIVRGMVLSFGGRMATNIITDPAGSAEEFRSITITEIQDRITNIGYQNTWIVRDELTLRLKR